ncbi:MAG: hypothetical protein DDT20_00724 [Firmicutes bacterium]|nr:hypothetical protein [Bacillota bacterium]
MDATAAEFEQLIPVSAAAVANRKLRGVYIDNQCVLSLFYLGEVVVQLKKK